MNRPANFIHNVPHSEEAKRKISEDHIRRYARGWNNGFPAKQVVAIRDGKLVSVFPSANSLAKMFGVKRDVICRVCRGERKSYRGFKLFYEEDFDKWYPHITD